MDALVSCEDPHGNVVGPANPADSSLREKLLEHLFVGELLRTLWRRGARRVELLRAEVDAGGMRVPHGQGLDVGGLLLTKGLALGLGPGLATAVSLTLRLSLSLLAGGGRAGGWLASDRGCSHGGAPRENGKTSRGRARHPPQGGVRGRRQ